MGIKGRKRRFRNFANRATAFAADVKRGRGFKKAIQDGRPILVGLGRHKRLVYKHHKSIEHITKSLVQQNKLVDYLERKKITPKHYVLVKIAFEPELRVQEYFQMPSMQMLEDYFRIKKGEKAVVPLSKNDELLCRQFCKRYKEVDLKKSLAAGKEIFKHLKQAEAHRVGRKLLEADQIGSNIIVVGTTKDSKLRLGIVDT